MDGFARLVPALAGATCLAAVQLLAAALLAHLHPRSPESRRRLVSASAGVSVAYVFVDVMPELGAQQRALAAADSGAVLLPERGVYALALLAFVVMYGLERSVLVASEQVQASGESGAGEAAGTSTRVLAWHLTGLGAYTALIGYLLVERAERGAAPFAAYVIAMAVHFVIVAHALAERHGARDARLGGWVLAAAVLVGWALGVSAEVREPWFARLFAVLAGGVIVTSVQRELDGPGRGRFVPFVLGAVAFAVLLLLT